MPTAKSDILVVLAEQHAEIDRLLARLFTPGSTRSITFLDLASRIAAHVAVETQIFYPAVMRESELRRESIAESIMLKRQVADMLGLEADTSDSEEFDLKLGQLADMIDRHAHRFEDDVLFPLLAEVMDDEEREALGESARTLYDSMLRHDDSNDFAIAA